MDIKTAAAAYNTIAGMTPAPSPNANNKTQSSDPSFAEMVSLALGTAVDSGHSAEKVSVLELHGLGAEVWQGIDAQAYVDQERSSWIG